MATDLGVFIKYPTIYDAERLMELKETSERKIFFEDLLKPRHEKLSADELNKIEHELYLNYKLSDLSESTIGPNYEMGYSKTQTLADYYFSGVNEEKQKLMWALRTLFWQHWRDWGDNELPNEDVLLDKAQEALNNDKYYLLYCSGDCLSHLLNDKKYLAYLYPFYAQYNIKDLSYLDTEKGINDIIKRLYNAFYFQFENVAFVDDPVGDFIPSLNNIKRACELADEPFKTKIKLAISTLEKIICEVNYRVANYYLTDIKKDGYPAQYEFVEANLAQCPDDYKNTQEIKKEITAFYELEKIKKIDCPQGMDIIKFEESKIQKLKALGNYDFLQEEIKNLEKIIYDKKDERTQEVKEVQQEQQPRLYISQVKDDEEERRADKLRFNAKKKENIKKLILNIIATVLVGGVLLSVIVVPMFFVSWWLYLIWFLIFCSPFWYVGIVKMLYPLIENIRYLADDIKEVHVYKHDIPYSIPREYTEEELRLMEIRREEEKKREEEEKRKTDAIRDYIFQKRPDLKLGYDAATELRKKGICLQGDDIDYVNRLVNLHELSQCEKLTPDMIQKAFNFEIDSSKAKQLLEELKFYGAIKFYYYNNTYEIVDRDKFLRFWERNY